MHAWLLQSAVQVEGQPELRMDSMSEVEGELLPPKTACTQISLQRASSKQHHQPQLDPLTRRYAATTRIAASVFFNRCSSECPYGVAWQSLEEAAIAHAAAQQLLLIRMQLIYRMHARCMAPAGVAEQLDSLLV